MKEKINVTVLIIGAGTAATNAAREVVQSGVMDVVIVHPVSLLNTCIEEGCMPSKSVLAGAHAKESLASVEATRNKHIVRLRSSLSDSIADAKYTEVIGTAHFISPHEVVVVHEEQETVYRAEKIVIATGSKPHVPPIPGLDPSHPRILISDDVVSERAHFEAVPQSVLVTGSGPIGLELATFFHDMGTKVDVLQRGTRFLPTFDSEFGAERYRASQDAASFPIHTEAELNTAQPHESGVTCRVTIAGQANEKEYEYVLVATGRRPNIDGLNLAEAGVALDEHGVIKHDATLRTSVPHIFIAGDVTNHHQILHYAAEMGKIAGKNAASDSNQEMDYDRHLLAVSFDQYPSALIGLTETQAIERGMKVVTATKHFNSIGLGILKRQEYGLWKLVAEAGSGRVVGAQVVGPRESGELVQLLTPIIWNQNTAADIMQMTWYHPTYAEILHSLARDICNQSGTDCPEV